MVEAKGIDERREERKPRENWNERIEEIWSENYKSLLVSSLALISGGELRSMERLG